MVDHEKIRRESIRWYLLLTLHNAAPVGCYEEVLHQTMVAIYHDVTLVEIRKELSYLEHRILVGIKREASGRWYADLARYGTDLVEYTIDCEPGIARPVKNWG